MKLQAYTSAHMAFLPNIERARYFVDIHEEVHHGPGAPPLRYRELPRAAVVFAIGALDAYISDALAEVVVKQLERGVASGDLRNTLRQVEKDLPTLAIELALTKRDADRAALLRTALYEHFQLRVTHGASAVSGALQRLGAHATGMWDNVAIRTGDIKPQQSLDFWTNVRHDIVHRGKKPTVHRHRARGCLNLVAAIETEFDQVAVDLY